MTWSSQKHDTLKAFQAFHKLELSEKLDLLQDQGILLDSDEEKDKHVQLYFIRGFFVEKMVSKSTGAVIELIPYKNGYRVYNFLN